MSTWITLDGPLHDEWCSPLKTLITDDKEFHETNRRSHHLGEHVKIIYETDNLTGASPSFVSSMGVCFVGSTVVGWRPLADAWLAGKPSKHIHALQVGAIPSDLTLLDTHKISHGLFYISLSKGIWGVLTL